MTTEIRVQVENTGELLTFMVSPEDAVRAAKDSAYLRRLVDQEYSRRSEAAILEEFAGSGQTLAESAIGESPTEESAMGDSATVEPDDTNKSFFIWMPQCVNLLLTLYEENIENFDSGVQRHQKIWTQIASKMKLKGYQVTWMQCQSKLNGLKRTYKKIIDHNNVSGNDRKSWPYFERIHEIFSKTGWVQPKAIATEDGPDQPTACDDEFDSSQTSKKRKTVKNIEVIFSEFREERKAAQQVKERNREKRHREKQDKIEEMIARKEKQHNEKMDMMKLWLQAITPKK